MRIDRRRQGGARPRAKKRRLGGLGQAPARGPGFDFHHDPMFWDADIPIAQRLLNSACNDRRVNPRLLAKALRMGASFASPCGPAGELAHHRLARHGESPFDASLLESLGADMAAVDHFGRGFAHCAFDALNLAMARWIIRRHPAAARRMDSSGLEPADLALGGGSSAWRPAGARETFLDWAAREAPGCQSALVERGFSSALRGISNGRDSSELAPLLDWMVRRGAKPASAQAMSEAIDTASPWDRDRLRDALRPWMALSERSAIEEACPPAKRAPSRRAL